MSDENGAAIETLSFVTRSTCRVRILETLARERAVSRTELRSTVDVVRTTLQRNLEALDERGLINENGRSYEITPAGSLVASGLEESLDRIETANRLRPVLERIPVGTFEFDTERLADAAVVESTPSNPYRPVEAHQRRLTDGTDVRLLLPATGIDPIETSEDAIAAGAVHDIVLTRSVVEAIQTDSSLTERFESLLEYDTVSVSVLDDDSPFYLGIVDETVQIGVHDEAGLPTALLESTDPVVEAWAVERFERAKSRSEPIASIEAP